MGDALDCAIKQEIFFAHVLPVMVFMSILYIRATQLILTKVQLEKFRISRGGIEFLICYDENETLISSTYRKINGFSLSLH